MQKFKNNVSEGWLMKQELRFFRNFMRNWDCDVEDCDFFDIFANNNNSDGAERKKMLKKYFSLEELAKCDARAKSERKRNFENGVLTDDPALVNPLVEQFDSVWRGAFCRECGRREHCPDPVV